MATETVTALDELTSPAANDEIGIWDVSAAQYMRITRANLVGGTITGGGTIATGGFTLTVPATGTAALLGTANVYTAAQTINTALSSAALTLQRSGVDAVQLNALSGDRGVAMPSFDNSASYGPYVNIGRNSNASTPASGHVIIRNLNNQYYSIWVDASANLRIVAGAQPTNATDTGGTVVGTQTSMAAAKYLADDVTPINEVLASIQQAATAAVRRFTYRSGAFNGEAFEGVVTDLAPRYGMDRDREHPAGKSLNEITLLGDLLRAVAHLSERVAALER